MINNVFDGQGDCLFCGVCGIDHNSDLRPECLACRGRFAIAALPMTTAEEFRQKALMAYRLADEMLKARRL